MLFKYYAGIYYNIKSYRRKIRKVVNLKRIEVALTLILIIVTFLLVKATNSIKNVEIYFAMEKQKDEYYHNLDLADNLIGELENSKDDTPNLKNTLNKSRKIHGITLYTFSTQRLDQARKSEYFGYKELRIILDQYSTGVSYINDLLKEIINDDSVGDFKIKDEHTGTVLRMLDGMPANINLLEEALNEYKANLKIKIERLDNETYTRLLIMR